MDDMQPPEVTVASDGAIKLITLDRPRALNALTAAMRAAISEALWAAARDPMIYAVVIQSASERAFSAGSDVREVIGLARSDRQAALRLLGVEYALNWQCECFSKPTVPLINGMVMGGGVGISLYGTHRVAGEGYRFAMPETVIGLFPDVGVCQCFARLPGSVGQYLGLTGRGVGRADAYALGLVTHCIDAEHFDGIKRELAEAWPVDTILDRLHKDPGAGEIALHAAMIDRCFSQPTVEAIMARLEAETGSEREFALGVLADLRLRSPLSLKVTHRHIREAAKRDIRETLIVDYRLAKAMLDGHDFYEGVRAQLIDKDHAPSWQPPSLELVSAETVDRYFAPLGDADLELPTREKMQELRA